MQEFTDAVLAALPLQQEGARVLHHVTGKSYAEIVGLMHTAQ